MKKRDSVVLGDMYGKLLNRFKYNLKEQKNAFGDIELVGDGPEVDGYHEALHDEKPKTKDCEEDEEDDIEDSPPTRSEGDPKRIRTYEKLIKLSKDPKFTEEKRREFRKQADSYEAEEAEEEKIVDESRKIARSMVNNIMSKSVFDRLYSKCLKENFNQDDGGDIDALGLDNETPDAEFGDEGDDFGDDVGEEGGDITFTLPRDVAQQLIDVLQGALGEGGEDDLGDDFGDDLDFGDEGGDDLDFGGEDEFDNEEDEEVQGTKTAPDKKKAFQGKSTWKVSGPPQPKSGKAKSDVTDDVSTKEGAPPIAALQGKNNQVPGSSLKKASDFFK